MHCNTVKLTMFDFHNSRFILVIFYYIVNTIIINPFFTINLFFYCMIIKNGCGGLTGG